MTTAAKVNESTVLEQLLDSIPPVQGKRGRPRRRPEKLHADKGYRSRKNQKALLTLVDALLKRRGVA